MVTVGFGICLAASIFLLVYVAAKNYENISVYSWTLLILIPIVILGYWLKSRAASPEAAEMAFCFIYLDTSVLLVVALFTMLHALGVGVNPLVKLVFYTAALVHIILVWGSYGTGLFYSSIDVIRTSMGTATIVHSGPLKVYHEIYLVVMIAAIVGTIIYFFFKKGTHSKIVLYNFTVVAVVFAVVYSAELILQSQFSFLPYLYVFADVIVATTYDHMHMHDISCVVSQQQKYHGDKGFVAVSYKRHFMSCNEKAFEFMPFLREQTVDAPLPADHPIFNEMIDQYHEQGIKTRKAKTGDTTLVFDICETSMRKDGRKQGYLFDVRDATDEQLVLDAMNTYNKKLDAELALRAAHIIDIQQRVTVGMANMIENRDNNTGGHVKRTSDVVRILMDEVVSRGKTNISPDLAENIVRAAPLHDLGKMNIDSSILCKPGRLTDEEFEVIKTHPVKSGEMVRILLDGVEEQDFVDTAYNIARYHHERWDGRGYPEGLTGKQIPVEARVMAVADVYDALVSKRCYKEPMSFEEAADIMLKGMGSQFDPGLEVVFRNCREKLEEYYRKA